MTSPQADDLAALKSAVERSHGVPARFVASEPVHEVFLGATVWRGTVSLFDLVGHAQASQCYAWLEPPETYKSVLRVGPVDTASKAVRAAIVAAHRKPGG